MFKINMKQFFLFGLVGLFCSSCDNDSNPVGPQEEHLDAEGMELLINEVVVYKEFKGAYYTNGVISNTSAEISVPHLGERDIEVRFLDDNEDVIEHHDDEGGDEDELNFNITDSNIISAEIHEEYACVCSDYTDASSALDESSCEIFFCDDGMNGVWNHEEHYICECEDESDTSSATNQLTCETISCNDSSNGNWEVHHELEFELEGLQVGGTTFTLLLMHNSHADYTSKLITVTVGN